jgi:hypothetical protein
MMANMQRWDALVTVPLPTFSHRIWEGLTSTIPVGLNENEIRDVHRFHARLDELIRFKGISADPRSQWCKKVEGVINGLIEKGNPIGKQGGVVVSVH